jgi:type I restriction enzyme S subunit
VSDWDAVAVGELGRVITGKTPKTAIMDNYGGTIPFLTPSDNMNVKYIGSTGKTLTKKGLLEVKNCLLPAGAICVSCIGSDLGKVVMTTQPTVTNQQINSIVPADDVNKDFVYYAMTLLGTTLNNDSKTSTAVPIINKSTFSKYEIELPSLSEQTKIADTLKAFDDKIANNTKINHHLEQMAQAIFKSWFVDFEPWGGVRPDDWREGTLGDAAIITSGKRPPFRQATASVDADIPLIGASSIMGFTNAVLYNERILITGRVGTHGVIQRYSRPCWASDNTLVIKSDNYEFVYQQLCIVDFHNMNRGSTQPLITQTDLKNVPVVLPNEATLRDFEYLVGSLMEQYEDNICESECIAELRDTLLPRLMSGEVCPQIY